MYQYKECGLSSIYLENGFERRQTPYGEGVAIRDIKGLHKAIGKYVTGKADRLTPEEVRFLRTEMDMSQKVLASTLAVKEITVRKWESGENKINPTADLLLRVCYMQYINEDSQVRDMVDRLNHLDRSEQKDQLHFQISDHWKVSY